MSEKTCYQCGEAVSYLFEDGRGKCCTRLTPEEVAGTEEPEQKKYNIVYADPGWKYGSGGVRSGRYAKLDYRTMPTREIAALPVRELAADVSALFLWATSPFLEDAMVVGKAWGFKYIRVDKVWEKTTAKGNPHLVVGPWGFTETEFLLLFTRGPAHSFQAVSNQRQKVEAPFTGKHSEKPAIFRQLIEERFKDDWTRVELFARTNHPGWDAWGDEVDESIAWAGVKS